MAANELFTVPVGNKKLSEYRKLTPDILERIGMYSKKLSNLRISHVNATSLGGGVAEMFVSQIPLERDFGFKSNWLVIPPDDAFFEVTKKIHNFSQGKEGDLTDNEKKLYLNHNKKIAGLLDKISTDILIIHDPQPAASLYFMNNKPKLSVWRCHIDTSSPNEKVWRFLKDYLNVFDRFIFTMSDFVHEGISKEKTSLMTPVIDPFAPKNALMEKNRAKQMLKQLGINMNKPLITQVSRLDPWKDPIGVIDAFEMAKESIPGLQLAFVAQMAPDDPEGVRVASQVKKYAKDKKDILFFINLEDNDRLVNAFQTASDAVIQKSIREGFALTVTEAMWKGAAVIGGNVGGIRLQIENGKNGFLVNSTKEAAEKIVLLVNNNKIKNEISKKAHESVKAKYLMPQLILNELKLFSTHF